MADIDNDIRELFREAPEDVGFEISFEDEGRGLDLDGLAFVMRHLWWCREYVTAVAAYARHVLDPDGSVRDIDPAMAEFVAAIAADDPGGIDKALQALVIARVNSTWRSAQSSFPDGPFPYFVGSDPGDLRFEFFAGVHENPTRLAFLVMGALVPVTLTVMIVGMSGLHRQYGEQACIERARDTTHQRIEMLRKMHRLEGRMSPALQDNLNSIIKAGDAAELRCRSLLDRFDYKITVPPGFTFEIALGTAPSGP